MMLWETRVSRAHQLRGSGSLRADGYHGEKARVCETIVNARIADLQGPPREDRVRHQLAQDQTSSMHRPQNCRHIAARNSKPVLAGRENSANFPADPRWLARRRGAAMVFYRLVGPF